VKLEPGGAEWQGSWRGEDSVVPHGAKAQWGLRGSPMRSWDLIFFLLIKFQRLVEKFRYIIVHLEFII
jgi:hypothetical protein